MPETAVEFDSPAWILVGLTRTLPGWMAYQNGCVAFADCDGDVIFSAPCAEITHVTFPWYYFGGGLKLRVLDQRYRISFVRPNGTTDISSRPAAWRSDAQNAAAVAKLVETKFRDIRDGRAVTRVWKKLLTAQQ